MQEPPEDWMLDDEEERAFLDAIAPEEDETRVPIDPEIQGCASCGYDPDFCGCEAYEDLIKEEDRHAGPY